MKGLAAALGGAGLVSLGCAAAPEPLPSRLRVLAPDYARSAPPARPGAALTGRSVSVVLDPDRDRATRCVRRYLDALGAGDVDAALGELAPVIGGTTPGAEQLRETLRARHQQWAPSFAAAQGLELVAPSLCAQHRECRQAVLGPGDWFAVWRLGPRATRNGLAPPESAVLRVVDGEARIVGLSTASLAPSRF
ncbi:MAG: hypothetical protein JNK72_18610 [Myxococcales bacterium]|nr:hypothetical protein [Myxococcales bacterium]